MNILFLCTANIQRSRTAEDHFSENYCKQHGTTVCTTDLLDWADRVFVMEPMHIERIEDNAGKHYLDEVEHLEIEDIYQYMQSDLVERLDTHKRLQFLKYKE
ncbi:MAG: phosphotyrosine protein phosphatase [Colwellia sp.]|uniref:hypothetical protein n=1 Tax=Alteromonadales TaxID=135622 RepID=UPI001D97B9B8|nr:MULTISPECIES: hypothetical protein [Alteromonadales]NQZ27818.1 phosphotyrosine protein phosphatase [Colwellia sp.]NRA80321.1 phosphotyrosine protein phosphatase [Pseudoalteromonas sp.]